MPDMEKVIHAVKTAFDVWIDEYTGCSWFKEDEVRQAKEDALAILNEQKAVEAEYEGDARSTWWWVCGECHTTIEDNDKFCKECGRRILWGK